MNKITYFDIETIQQLLGAEPGEQLYIQQQCPITGAKLELRHSYYAMRFTLDVVAQDGKAHSIEFFNKEGQEPEEIAAHVNSYANLMTAGIAMQNPGLKVNGIIPDQTWEHAQDLLSALIQSYQDMGYGYPDAHAMTMASLSGDWDKVDRIFHDAPRAGR